MNLLPQLPQPYVPVPQLPSVQPPRLPMLGGYNSLPDPDYLRYQRELEERKEWFFDRNNPNQDNSMADVIIHSLHDLVDNFKNIVSDPLALPKVLLTPVNMAWRTANMAYKGVVTPIIKKDGAALINNAWNNFMESVDIIDNFYKGYAINKELDGMRKLGVDPNTKRTLASDAIYASHGSQKAGLEGIKRAWNRENFDFEGGSFGRNMTREFVTPTNVLLLGLGAAAKTGATSLKGLALSKRATKFIAREYTGDLTKTLGKAVKTGVANADDVVKINKLLEGSKAVTMEQNFRFLSHVNKIKKPIEAVDSLGGRLAWATTGAPAWYMVKESYKMGTSAFRYMGKTFQNIAYRHVTPGKALTLMDFELSGAASEMKAASKTFGAVLNEDVIVRADQAYYNLLAKNDSQALDDAIKKLYVRTDEGDLLLKSLGDDGARISMEEAANILQLRGVDKLEETLDAFATSASNHRFSTFQEYADELERLYNSNTSLTPEVKRLYYKVRTLRDLPKRARVTEQLDTVKDTLNRVTSDGISAKESVGVWEDFTKAFNRYHATRLKINEIEEAFEKFAKRKLGTQASPRLFQLSYDEDGLADIYINRAFLPKGALGDETYKEYMALAGEYLDHVDTLRELHSLVNKEGILQKLSTAYDNINISLAALKESDAYKALKGLDPNEYMDFAGDFHTIDRIQARAASSARFIRRSMSEEMPPSMFLEQMKKLAEFDAEVKGVLYSIDSFKKVAKGLLKNAGDNPVDLLHASLNKGNAINKVVDNLMESGVLQANQTLVEQITKNYNQIPLDWMTKENFEFLSDPTDMIRLLEDAFNGFASNMSNEFKSDIIASLERLPNTIERLRDANIKNKKALVEDLFEDIYILDRFIKRTEDTARTVGRGVITDHATTTVKHVNDIEARILELQKEYRTLREYQWKDPLNAKGGGDFIPDMGDGRYKSKAVRRAYELHKEIESLYAEIEHLKYRSDKKMQETMRNNDDALNQLNALVDNFNKSFGITEDVVVRYQANAERIYETQFSALYRWATLSQAPAVKNVVELYASHMDDFEPAIQSMKGLVYFGQEFVTKLNAEIMNFRSGLTTLDKISETFKATTGIELPVGGIDDVEKWLMDFKDVQLAAIQVEKTLKGMGTFSNFLNDLSSAGLNEEVSLATLDAMESFYSLSQDLVTSLRNPNISQENMIYAITQQINSLLRSKNLRHNFRLDNVKDMLIDLDKAGEIDPDIMADYLKYFPDAEASHTAIADAMASLALRKHFFKEHGIHGRIVAIDIETNTLNKNIGTPNQIALVTDTGEKILFVRTGLNEHEMPITDSLYHILFGKDEATPLSTLKERFKKIYVEGDMQTFRDAFNMHSEDIRIIPVSSQEELARGFVHALEGLKPEGGKLVLDMYNGKGFDVDVLNRMFTDTNTNYYINKNTIRDSLLDLEEKFNVRKLTLAEQDKVEDLLKSYINSREATTEMMRATIQADTDISTMLLLDLKGDFVPSANKEFSLSLQRVIDFFKENPKGLLDDGTAQKSKVELTLLDDLLRSIREANKSLRTNMDELNAYRISTEDIPKYYKGDELMAGIHPSMRADKNVMALLYRAADAYGLAVPVLNVRTVQNSNIVYDWFGELKVSNTNALERYLDVAKKLNRIVDRLGNKDILVHTVDADFKVRAMYDLVRSELESLPVHSWKKFVLQDIPLGDSSIKNFAVLIEYYRSFIALAQKAKVSSEGLIERLKLIDPDIAYTLRNPELLYEKYGINAIDQNKRFFHKELEGDMAKLSEFIRMNAETGKQTLDILEANMDKVEFTTPLRRLYTIYHPIIEAMQGAEDVIEMVAKGEPKVAEAMYAELRTIYEVMDAVPSYHNLKQLLSKSPEDMAAFLWHYSKGGAYFNASDLASTGYTPVRNKIKVPDLMDDNQAIELYQTIRKNKKAYNDMGVILTEDHLGNIALELNKEMVEYFKTLPMPRLGSDYDFNELIEKLGKLMSQNETLAVAAPELTQSLRKVYEARRHILDILPNGAMSSLERMDAHALDNALKNIGGRKSAKAFTLEELEDLERFEGVPFNHTFFGHIDSRRRGMEFASFNPAKTMLNATQTLHGMLDMKHQYMLMTFGDDFKLSKIAEGMTDEEVFEFFKKSPHQKLAYLQETKDGLDFNVKRFIITKPEDIKTAREWGAVVMDNNTFTKAVQTINNNKLGSRLAEWMQKNVAVPWKIGVMGWNFWSAMRNVFDTALKNMVEANGDLSMAKAMYDATLDYVRYINTSKEVTNMMKKYSITAEAAVERVFKEGLASLNREVYDGITFFKQNAASSGMVRSMQEFYGNSVDKAFRKLQHEVGLSQPQPFQTKRAFEEFLVMDDASAMIKVQKDWGESVEMQRLLMGSRTDYRQYKRAYAMLDRYKGKELTVDRIVSGMKRPELREAWSPEARDFYVKAFEDTKDITYQEDIMSKLMHWAPIDRALDLHGFTEETLRLAMYRWLKDQGDSHTKAADRIVKVHFDYNNKTRAQAWIELAIPFSTFRRYSIEYWGEALSKNPKLIEIVGKYKNAQVDHSEYDVEDIMMRRAVQYHMMAGNIINNEKGHAIKLMPSVVDAMNFFMNPVGYVKDALNPLGVSQNVLSALTDKKPDYMSEEDFRLAQNRKLLSAIPFVGGWLNRLTHPDFSLVGNALYGGIVSKVWTPATRIQKPRIKKYYMKKPRRYYPRRYYPKKLRLRNSNQYVNTYWARVHLRNEKMFRNRTAYLNRWLRGANIQSSVIRSSIMTRGNNPRAKYISFPTNKYTVGMKATLFRSMILRQARR